MILVDANILVYATTETGLQSAEARTWLDGQLNGESPVGLPWPSLLAFLRLTTNPRVFDRAAAPQDAWNVVEYWLNCPSVWVPEPTASHRKVLARIFNEVKPAANLVQDAHLAALAIEHGLIVCTTDSDFGRFPGLKWENPLQA